MLHTGTNNHVNTSKRNMIKQIKENMFIVRLVLSIFLFLVIIPTLAYDFSNVLGWQISGIITIITIISLGPVIILQANNDLKKWDREEQEEHYADLEREPI